MPNAGLQLKDGAQLGGGTMEEPSARESNKRHRRALRIGGGIFTAMIIFCVSLVWFVLVSLIRLPHLKVFVYAFNSPALEAAWLQYGYPVLLMAGAVCSVILIILYIIYVIIRMFVPWPFKKIILSMAVFKTLRRTGIVALFDSILGVIFRRWPLKKRLGRAGYSIGTFFLMYTKYLLALMGLNSANWKELTKGSSSDAPPATKQERLRKSKPREQAFEAEENQQFDAQYQQCLEENTSPVTEDMSRIETAILNKRNSLNRSMCRLHSLQSYMNTFV